VRRWTNRCLKGKTRPGTRWIALRQTRREISMEINMEQNWLLNEAHKVCGPGSRQVVAAAIHTGIADDVIERAIEACAGRTADDLASSLLRAWP
jgi:hypothetical protein